MKKWKILLGTIFIFFLGFYLPLDGQAKTVKVASDIAYAPFEFQDTNKKWVGIDVDLMKEVAKINGWELDMSFPGFDAAVNNLKAGRVDAVMAGMSITPERQQVFDFGDPYYPSELVFATSKGEKFQVKAYSDLKDKIIGVKNGTAAQSWAQDHQDQYGYNIKTYKDGVQMLAALKAGNISAALDENPVLSYAIAHGEKLSIDSPPIKLGEYGFAVMKGQNQDLVQGFNTALAQMKTDGTYDRIIAKYTGQKSDAPLDSKATPKKSVYTIASDTVYAPFEFQNSNKKWTGIDVDLLNAIAKQQGFTLKWNFLGFQAAVNSVQAGQSDAIMAGMSITEARKQVFNFSVPYYDSGLTIAVKKGSPNVKSWKDLNGKTIGAKNGTASLDYLNSHQKEFGYQIKVFETGDSMYQSLSTGSIQAFMDDAPVIQYAVKQGQAFSTPLAPVPTGQYGFAVKAGTNPELLEMFNNGLAALKSSGEYDKIIAKYTKASSSSTDKVDESTFGGILANNWSQLLKGLGITLSLAIVAFVLAVIVGILFGLLSVAPNKVLRGIARVYIDLNRAIPLLVLIIFIFYGIPNLIQMITGHQAPLNEFVAGVIALTLNESSYIAETIRGGINAVPVGQMEASRSLGLPYVTTMRRIIIPQALKITIPSLINQFVITLKDTTLVSVIGLVELLQTGQIIVARNFQAFLVYGIVGLLYVIILLALMWLGRRVERRVK